MLSRLEVATVVDQETVQFGRVDVAGTTYGASFRVHGFDRRWDFESASYAFIIKPNGDGFYYGFSKEEEGVSPSQFFDFVME
jgi:hypothetical protein